MSPASRTCVEFRCNKPTASDVFPDLITADGYPANYIRCVDHALARLRQRITDSTYHASQLEAAQIASEGSR